MFGAGLWDWISAYIALGSDLNTIEGVAFDHKSETPGLGARIASAQIQDRYKGKQVFDEAGGLVSVLMRKGEGRSPPPTVHEVDGMSGATLTGKGVNTMLRTYLSHYLPYIEKQNRLSSFVVPTESILAVHEK